MFVWLHKNKKKEKKGEKKPQIFVKVYHRVFSVDMIDSVSGNKLTFF